MFSNTNRQCTPSNLPKHTNYFKYKYSAPPPIFRNTNYFKYKYSASLPILRNTNYFKYKYSAPLPMLRSKNYLFKCVLRLLVLLPLRSNKFLTAICWDFSCTSSLKCRIHLRVECIGNQSNCFTKGLAPFTYTVKL